MVSVDLEGREISLKNVPAEFNNKKKITRVDIDEVIKAEQEFIAKENNLEPREMEILWLLHADSRLFKGGMIEQKARFNKMQFYLSKRMEKMDYGKAFIRDEFASARSGPVPIHLEDDLKDLEAKGIVNVRWAKRRPGKSTKCTLTKLGEKVAESIWKKTPPDIRTLVKRTKEELYLIDARQLMDKVHKEYPEYKKTYIEPDRE
jgi:hypothetical protein